MERQKVEKLILLIIIPLLAAFLIHRFIGRVKQLPQAQTETVIPVTEQSQDIKPVEDLKSKIRKMEYKAGDKIDPLSDKLSMYVSGAGKETVNPPQLDITGLLWNSTRPQAIVNGRVISVGDEIEGAKLLSVDANGISIEYKGFEFFVNKK